MGAGQALAQSVAPLLVDDPALEGAPQGIRLEGVSEVAFERKMALGEGRATGGERVEERGGGKPGGRLHADVRAEPGLHPARHGRLGDDQRPHAPASAEDSTFQKSRAVRVVPRRLPLTFDTVPAARRR